MTLIERLEADRNTARKDRNLKLATFLSFVISEGRGVGKNDGDRESTDEEVVGAIRKIMKGNTETIELAPDNSVQQAWQNGVLKDYLPEQLSEDDLETLIREFVTGQNWTDEEISPKMMGPVMNMLKETRGGQYNPKTASDVARRVLTR